MNKKNKEVLEILYRTHPDAKCELHHETPLQLLIATILSAQATDKKVNEVTEKMFQKYKTLEDFLQMTMEFLLHIGTQNLNTKLEKRHIKRT